MGGSEAVEEGQGGVAGLVAAGRCFRWCGAVEGSLFDGHVGVQVDLCGFGLFVAEPERDHGGVDAGVEELHGRSVSEHVGCDGFEAGGVGVLLDEPFDGVAAHADTGAGGEEGVVGVAAALIEPGLEHGDGLLVQGVFRCFRPLPRQFTCAPVFR